MPSNPPPLASFKVIIVGSGLAGSLLANGLLKHDVDVTVYERLAQNSPREGYQITLGAPALAGFRACLSQQHIDSLISQFGRAGGRKSRAPIIYDSNFNSLVDLTRLPNYSKSAPINRRTLRDSLAQPVYDADALIYGKGFSHYEIVNEGGNAERVRVTLEDGTQDECHVLVAADGSHSRINAQVGLDNIKQLTSHWSFIVKTELPTDRLRRLPLAVLEKQALIFADNISIYFSVYLPEASDATTVSSCMFAAHLPVEICPSDIASRSSRDQLNLISSAIASWAKPWHDMIDLVRQSDVYAYRARVSSQPTKDWRRQARAKRTVESGHPRIWLLGDAIHAMLPNRGMGGNQAMQDTASMLPLLVGLAQRVRSESQEATTAEVALACQTYETEMIPRTFEWVRKSGGDSIVPIDHSKLFGKVFFFLLGQVINIAVIWYSVIDAVVGKSNTDDAPELR